VARSAPDRVIGNRVIGKSRTIGDRYPSSPTHQHRDPNYDPINRERRKSRWRTQFMNQVTTASGGWPTLFRGFSFPHHIVGGPRFPKKMSVFAAAKGRVG
jgi:hypothetical protein